jgi:hypothetical protein
VPTGGNSLHSGIAQISTADSDFNLFREIDTIADMQKVSSTGDEATEEDAANIMGLNWLGC